MSTAREPTLGEPLSSFSVASGGDLDRVLDALRLGGKSVTEVARRCVSLPLVTWTPLLVAALAEGSYSGGPTSFSRDAGVHARLLVALPLLLVAERTIERRFRGALAHLEEAGLVDDENRARVARVVALARRARDSRVAELAIVACVIALSVHDALSPIERAWMFRPGGAAGAPQLSLAGWIDLLMSMPVYRLVLLRWVWRWLVWSALLVGLGHAGLRLSALHSDRMGGLGVLAEAHMSAGWLLAAVGSALSGELMTQRLALGVSVAAFGHLVLVFVVLAVVVALAPMLAFVWPLERARRQAHEEYSVAAADFARRYRRAHLDPEHGAPVIVGSADPSSADDLGGSFERMLASRRVPLHRRQILFLLLCAITPLVPFYLQEIPLLEILQKLRDAIG